MSENPVLSFTSPDLVIRKGMLCSSSEDENMFPATFRQYSNVSAYEIGTSSNPSASETSRRQSSTQTVIEFSPQSSQEINISDRKRKSRLIRVGTIRSKRDYGSVRTLDPALLVHSDQWDMTTSAPEKTECERDAQQRVAEYALEQFHLLMTRCNCSVPKHYPYKKKRDAPTIRVQVLRYVTDENNVARSPSSSSSLFGSPLSSVRSQDLIEHTSKVSDFLPSALTWIEKHGLNEEGIFRRAGNISKTRQLRYLMESAPSAIDWSDIQYSPIEVASLVKQYIREMPEPLTTFQNYHLFLCVPRLSSSEIKIAALQLLLLALPQPLRNILIHLLRHLYIVQDKMLENKMDAHNLAVVFGPNLFPEQREKSFDQAIMSAIIDITEFMIWNYQAIIQPPEKFLERATQYVKPRGNVVSSFKRMIIRSVHEEEPSQLDEMLLQLTITTPITAHNTLVDCDSPRETTKILENPAPENASTDPTSVSQRAVLRVECQFMDGKSTKSHIVTDQSTASDIIRKSLKGVAEVKEGDYGLYRMGAHDTVLARIYNDTKLLPLIRDDPALTLRIKHI